jgi:hypothetical protein
MMQEAGKWNFAGSAVLGRAQDFGHKRLIIGRWQRWKRYAVMSNEKTLGH